MRHGMIGFASALVLSIVIHTLVLAAIWVDQATGTAGDAQATAIFIPTPRMGEPVGRGSAANSSAGERPAQARKALQEQAALGKLPQGANRGQARHEPSPPATPPAPVPEILPAEKVTDKGQEKRAATTLQWPDLATAAPPARQFHETSSGAGSPYQQSESESDPFSDAEHVEMHNGRVDPRFGRTVKTTRPDFGDEAEQALMDHVRLSVVLKVNTDASGKVTSVDVLRSSGSVAVDLAMKLAMYNWWIEPPKDKAGRARADVMVWKITFE